MTREEAAHFIDARIIRDNGDVDVPEHAAINAILAAVAAERKRCAEIARGLASMLSDAGAIPDASVALSVADLIKKGD